eukprot:m.214980 g.214980  ORF g.214980 m.214980 type:complete len:1254 (+) comp15873_c0_seq10:105-3866(+)
MAAPVEGAIAALENTLTTVPEEHDEKEVSAGDNVAARLHIVEHGMFGNVCVEKDGLDTSFLGTIPACGVPPIGRAETSEVVKAQVTDRFINNLSQLDIHNLEDAQIYWEQPSNPKESQIVDFPLEKDIIMKITTDLKTGEGVSFSEVPLKTGPSSAQSLSMGRPVGEMGTFVKGSSSNVPFYPGGLQTSSAPKEKDSHDDLSALDTEVGLLDTPPGFEEGMVFEKTEKDDGSHNPPKQDLVTAQTMKTPNVPLSDILMSSIVPQPQASQEGQSISNTDTAEDETAAAAVDAALEVEVSKPKVEKSQTTSKTWAVKEDGDMNDFHALVPQMARKYPFELDIFQKQAVMHLERHESVFVAAHTSAGKTVVADYAIALCNQHMTRCIYTSPIKALSNQKFRDFKDDGVDVGLLTGDIQLRPEASCLIMTTEILRSMLYKGADLIRDVEWVIFDEVHYVNDPERGVVWEEVIIMLPSHVNLILLSATVPNTFEFADWVGRTKQRHIYVISTMKRPVPLEHFLYTGNSKATSNELFKIVDSRSTFLTDGYKKAMKAKLSRQSDKDKSFGAKGRQRGAPGSDKGLYVSLVDMLAKKELRPCVVFTFSKKRCESNADSLLSMDMTSNAEKSEIHVFIDRALSRLKGSDRNLPQVGRMREMLKRGVGVHHGGLLPLMKEMVEMLFGRGLVKVLFATETFAMGVNMPARCVVFDTCRKHDGTKFRDLLAGEYIQMAGRAGRRGLDKTGTVIILVKGDVPEQQDLTTMMLGVPIRLDSKFRLTYNMILNLLRVEELRVEDMMKRSFAENFSQKNTADKAEELQQCTEELEAIQNVECEYCIDLPEFYDTCSRVMELTYIVQAEVLEQGSKFLQSGRVVVVNNQIHRNALAVIVRTEQASHKAVADGAPQRYTVLVIRDKENSEQPSSPYSALPVTTLFLPQNGLGYSTPVINGTDILSITKERLKISPIELVDKPNPQAQMLVAQSLLRLAEQGVDLLDPVTDMKLKGLTVVDAWGNCQKTKAKLDDFKCKTCPDLTAHYGRIHEKKRLDAAVKNMKYQLSDESLHMLPDYNKRVQVLKNLKYIDDTCAVQLKGRVACEISTCDELIATELVFENSLTHLQPAEIVALLSALVFQEKVDNDVKLTQKLQEGVDNMKRIAKMIAEEQLCEGMDTPTDEYVRTLHFGLVEVVYAWANGVPFAEITNLTDVLEGSIVRCIVRLDETCRDVRNAARVIGDPVLYQKMDEASTMIKRDIVFAASLYTA